MIKYTQRKSCKLIYSGRYIAVYSKIKFYKEGDPLFKTNWLYLDAQLVKIVGRTFYQMVGDTTVNSKLCIMLKLAVRNLSHTFE